MAKSSGLGMALYVAGYDLSGDVGSVESISSPIALLDVPGINRSAMERIQGVRDGMVDFTAFFNPDSTAGAEGEHTALSTLVATDRLVQVLMGTTRGDAIAALTSKQTNYDPTRSQDGALTFAVHSPAAAGIALEWGIVLVAKTTHASATTETGILDGAGAQTTKGAVGFLQAFDAASGTVEYDIDDSSDSTNGVDGTWATLLSFTDVAAASHPTAERVAVNGTVEKYVRAVTEGTFADADFSISFRRRDTNDLDAA